MFATCLTGCGGWTSDQFFHLPFPSGVLSRFASIHQLEALAIVVGVRLWGPRLAGLRIQVYCDNAAVVSALNSGRVLDPLLAVCLRELWFYVAVYDFELRAVHLASSTNRRADLLSRWHLNDRYSADFFHDTADLSLMEASVPNDIFQLSELM